MFWRKKPPVPATAPPPPPPEVSPPDGTEEPADPRYWIERLAMRAARLQRAQLCRADTEPVGNGRAVRNQRLETVNQDAVVDSFGANRQIRATDRLEEVEAFRLVAE